MKKILIANRGEIACRIIKTCKALGIRTVCVHSAEEKNSLHRIEADESYELPAEGTASPYLDINSIVVHALASQVDAVHPGYGFLSENANFARMLEKVGVKFVGPSSQTLTLLGEKNSARELALKLSIPVLPGYQGNNQSIDNLKIEAKKIGFPLMIKGVSGGGGRGMRLVNNLEKFETHIVSAINEARQHFSNPDVILESYLKDARHIEVQIIADSHGNLLHLFERECSLQRRSQKVIEEAPAPFLDKTLRQQIHNAAITLAKSANLEGASTFEFLISNKDFYFLEANCRIQVEHPVTEAITGIDIVEQQLRIAFGEALSFTQKEVISHGHAVESRIYAESPAENFLPSTGVIDYLDISSTIDNPNLRFDHSLYLGQKITVNFDPMLGKLIAKGESREEALTNMRQSLEEIIISGVNNNIPFLRNVISHLLDTSNQVTTSYLENNLTQFTADPIASHSPYVVCARLISEHFLSKNQSNHSDLYIRPGHVTENGWTLVFQPPTNYIVNELSSDKFSTVSALTYSVKSDENSIILKVNIDGEEYKIEGLQFNEDSLPNLISVNGLNIPILQLSNSSTNSVVRVGTRHYKVKETGILGTSNDLEEKIISRDVLSPLPGIIQTFKVSPGDTVEKGDLLFTIESMKMEHIVKAHTGGTIEGIKVKQGDKLEKDQLVLQII